MSFHKKLVKCHHTSCYIHVGMFLQVGPLRGTRVVRCVQISYTNRLTRRLLGW